MSRLLHVRQYSFHSKISIVWLVLFSIFKIIIRTTKLKNEWINCKITVSYMFFWIILSTYYLHYINYGIVNVPWYYWTFKQLSRFSIDLLFTAFSALTNELLVCDQTGKSSCVVLMCLFLFASYHKVLLSGLEFLNQAVTKLSYWVAFKKIYLFPIVYWELRSERIRYLLSVNWDAGQLVPNLNYII